MNFQEVKNYFHTLNEAKNFRSQLWKKNNIIIENLTEKLYDDFDIEESVFIINDFFNKDIYSLDKIDVLIKLDDKGNKDIKLHFRNQIYNIDLIALRKLSELYKQKKYE